MNNDDIGVTEQIKQMITEMFGVSPIKLENGSANLGDDLGLDSIDTIDLLLKIDNDLGLKFYPHDFQECVTLDQFIAVINSAIKLK